MKRNILTNIVVAGIATIAFPSLTVAQQPGVRRTELQRYDLSSPGREVIQSRIDFVSWNIFRSNNSHPGEEIIYVLEGQLVYEVEGNPR